MVEIEEALVVLPLGVFGQLRKEKKEPLLIKRGFLEKLNGWSLFGTKVEPLFARTRLHFVLDFSRICFTCALNL